MNRAKVYHINPACNKWEEENHKKHMARAIQGAKSTLSSGMRTGTAAYRNKQQHAGLSTAPSETPDCKRAPGKLVHSDACDQGNNQPHNAAFWAHNSANNRDAEDKPDVLPVAGLDVHILDELIARRLKQMLKPAMLKQVESQLQLDKPSFQHSAIHNQQHHTIKPSAPAAAGRNAEHIIPAGTFSKPTTAAGKAGIPGKKGVKGKTSKDAKPPKPKKRPVWDENWAAPGAPTPLCAGAFPVPRGDGSKSGRSSDRTSNKSGSMSHRTGTSSESATASKAGPSQQYQQQYASPTKPANRPRFASVGEHAQHDMPTGATSRQRLASEGAEKPPLGPRIHLLSPSTQLYNLNGPAGSPGVSSRPGSVASSRYQDQPHMTHITASHMGAIAALNPAAPAAQQQSTSSWTSHHHDVGLMSLSRLSSAHGSRTSAVASSSSTAAAGSPGPGPAPRFSPAPAVSTRGAALVPSRRSSTTGSVSGGGDRAGGRLSHPGTQTDAHPDVQPTPSTSVVLSTRNSLGAQQRGHEAATLDDASTPLMASVVHQEFATAVTASQQAASVSRKSKVTLGKSRKLGGPNEHDDDGYEDDFEEYDERHDEQGDADAGTDDDAETSQQAQHAINEHSSQEGSAEVETLRKSLVHLNHLVKARIDGLMRASQVKGAGPNHQNENNEHKDSLINGTEGQLGHNMVDECDRQDDNQDDADDDELPIHEIDAEEVERVSSRGSQRNAALPAGLQSTLRLDETVREFGHSSNLMAGSKGLLNSSDLRFLAAADTRGNSLMDAEFDAADLPKWACSQEGAWYEKAVVEAGHSITAVNAVRQSTLQPPLGCRETESTQNDTVENDDQQAVAGSGQADNNNNTTPQPFAWQVASLPAMDETVLMGTCNNATCKDGDQGVGLVSGVVSGNAIAAAGALISELPMDATLSDLAHLQSQRTVKKSSDCTAKGQQLQEGTAVRKSSSENQRKSGSTIDFDQATPVQNSGSAGYGPHIPMISSWEGAPYASLDQMQSLFRGAPGAGTVSDPGNAMDLQAALPAHVMAGLPAGTLAGEVMALWASLRQLHELMTGPRGAELSRPTSAIQPGVGFTPPDSRCATPATAQPASYHGNAGAYTDASQSPAAHSPDIFIVKTPVSECTPSSQYTPPLSNTHYTPVSDDYDHDCDSTQHDHAGPQEVAFGSMHFSSPQQNIDQCDDHDDDDDNAQEGYGKGEELNACDDDALGTGQELQFDGFQDGYEFMANPEDDGGLDPSEFGGVVGGEMGWMASLMQTLSRSLAGEELLQEMMKESASPLRARQ